MSQQQNNWKGRTILFLFSQCITLFGSIFVQMVIVWYTDCGNLFEGMMKSGALDMTQSVI